jgi:aspartate/methionine/tyrosine aminotransferase
MSKSQELSKLVAEAESHSLHIKLGGFKTSDLESAMQARDAVAKALQDSGLEVFGMGMGANYMDISFDNPKGLDTKAIVSKVMKQFGIAPAFYEVR